MHRALLLAVILGTVGFASDVQADDSVVLVLTVTGRYPSRVKLYSGRRYAPNDSVIPFFDMQIQPGQGVAVPFVECIWWKRSIGRSKIDWTPLQYRCPPRRPPYSGIPSPYVVSFNIQN